MPSRTLTTTAAEIFPQNLLRKSWNIQNEDATINVFVKKERDVTVSSTDHDHRIGPGGNLPLNSLLDGIAAIQERWTIVAASGTPRVSFFETEDVVR